MDIRKISVGPDYKTAMHYMVGQDVLGGSHTIELIQRDELTGGVKVWIKDADDSVVCWKEFTSNVPISIEYNINF